MEIMASFDVVSTVAMHEVVNAVDQVKRELAARYDLKGTPCRVELKEKEGLIEITADSDLRMKSLEDLLKQRLAKRSVSLKSVEFREAAACGGDLKRQEVAVKQGLTEDELKRLAKLVKQAKFKVTAQMQADQLRVSGKKRDDLQEVISLLRREAQDLDLQFVNFRD
jgi:cyclic-di-GMP-binding protein